MLQQEQGNIMIQQRLGENDEEYEKGKRRVKLSYMIGSNSLAHGSSAILALIFYQDTLKNFVYDTDENGNAILTQKGSFDKDGLLYTGRGLELGATNDLPIDTTGCASLVYHDGTNYVVVQSPSNPYTFNNETVLEILPTTETFTTADLALIEADTTLLAKLALGEDNAGGLSLVTADVYGWYPFTENEGAYVIDAKAGYGTEHDIVTHAGHVGNIAEYVRTGDTIVCNVSIDGANIYYNGSSSGLPTGIFIFKVVCSNYISGDVFTKVVNSDGFIIDGNGEYFGIYKGDVNNRPSLDTRSSPATNTGFVGDLQLYSYEATAEEITDYLSSIRKNVDQNQKGPQTTYLELDGVGVPTAVDFTKLHWYGVGYNNTKFNPSLYSEFVIEENVGVVFYSHIYDGVNLTTWTDGVEGIPTAHSPENAEYLLAKGVYPKVAAEPYTIYTQDCFKNINNATQIADYDALQAYNDWAGI